MLHQCTQQRSIVNGNGNHRHTTITHILKKSFPLLRIKRIRRCTIHHHRIILSRLLILIKLHLTHLLLLRHKYNQYRHNRNDTKLRHTLLILRPLTIIPQCKLHRLIHTIPKPILRIPRRKIIRITFRTRDPTHIRTNRTPLQQIILHILLTVTVIRTGIIHNVITTHQTRHQRNTGQPTCRIKVYANANAKITQLTVRCIPKTVQLSG
mmetsp:Transcript_2264/g.3103  ORF Transcript_2264/g.3103 Transcript_2264/m.3103 type:complete len:209 (-) Transcript_2264:245-871(-)